MKIQSILFLLFLSLISACGSKKEKASIDQLYGNTWQLEYMSGPRIAFDGLFPDKKPELTFNKETSEVSGNNSCNGYSAKYTLEGNSISFGEPGPTTMMFCGEGEPQFLAMMKKINAYDFDADGKLNLMIEDVPMMRFKKTQK
ncbi:META domain-containing protein [Xanthomarina sp. GH4-25]|uniref:META domain-containing protein n=1 Tax=Xanthomarina sp. GH4-25 TaxID=3349335 RepID=UPI003877D13C